MYIKRGDSFFPTNDQQLDIHEELPAGFYTANFDKDLGFYFQPSEPFELPKKIYGESLERCERIISTFQDRSVSTGALLLGEKGSGKTLLAKLLAITVVNHLKKPVILVNAPFRGDGFNRLIQSAGEAMVLFDEFEKVYGERDEMDPQEEILTLFDGVFSSKKLFVLTCNNEFKLNEHLRNRPGRLYYCFRYDGLEEAFIREYCADTLKDLSKTDSIVKASTLFFSFNFDMLKAIVEETNRYGGDVVDTVQMLNMSPSKYGCEYHVQLKVKGRDIPVEELSNGGDYEGNPLMTSVISIGYNNPETNEWERVKFPRASLISSADDTFCYKTAEGNELILKKAKSKKFSEYYEAF